MAKTATALDSRAEARAKAAADLEKALEKAGVPGAGRKLRDQTYVRPPLISTRTLGIDRITAGGVPRGRISEIYGNESSGKTTLCLMLMAEAQARGGEVAFVDAEYSFDPEYAAALGVDVNAVRMVHPDSGEQALDAVELMVESGLLDLIVIDSVAALVPRAELEGDMGDAAMGAQARLMSQACRKLAGKIAKTQTAVVFINQTREKIGVMFGNPETTTGGKALKFYASLRLSLRPAKPIKSGEEQVGMEVRVKVVKSKQCRPMQVCVVPFLYGVGFDTLGELVDEGVEAGVFTKSGAWYSYGDERIGQGREAALDWLRTRPEVQQIARTAILTMHETGEVVA